MARTPPKRQVRKTRVAAPINQSRAAGRTAPESAASTSPEPFYSAREEEVPAVATTAMRAHVDTVRAEAVALTREAGVDARVAVAAQDEPDREESLEDAIARISQLRRPMGAYTQKLALPSRSGYYTHWFNDEGGRIDDALANGWAFRKDKDGKPYKRAVGSGRDRGVLYAFAMELPIVFWQEDMTARHKEAASKMDSLKASPFKAMPGQAKPSDAGKFYSPVEGSEPIEIHGPG